MGARDWFMRSPVAGQLKAAELTPHMLDADLLRSITGKVTHPKALLRGLRNSSANGTTVGEVTTSQRMPLRTSGVRLLEALAAADAVRQPESKVTLQVTCGNSFCSMPIDRVVRDQRLNVRLRTGAGVAAIVSPLSFAALKATGKKQKV